MCVVSVACTVRSVGDFVRDITSINYLCMYASYVFFVAEEHLHSIDDNALLKRLPKKEVVARAMHSSLVQ